MDDKEIGLEIIPALYIYKNCPVKKESEGYEPMKNEDGENLSINDIINKLSENHTKVLLLDLSGINRDRPQLDAIKGISTKMDLWVDAGTRIGQGVIDVLVAGADNVVLGTKTLLGLDELEKAYELTENIILEIGYDEHIVSPKRAVREMSLSSLSEKARDLGLKELIFTDLKSTASGSDPDTSSARQVLSGDMEVYLHGRFKETLDFSGLGFKGLIKDIDTP